MSCFSGKLFKKKNNNNNEDDLNMGESENIKNLIFKILIIGDINVGKTSLMMRFIGGEFVNSNITQGFDFKEKVIKLNNGVSVNARVWDTAGQERFRTITASYYRGADGIIICYDKTDEDSFNNVAECWMVELERSAREGIPVMVVGCKNDLDEVIDYNTGKEYCNEYNITFFETSSKTGENVDNVFNELCELINKHKQEL
eukprot:TRINITY_DN2052_c5_g1_i1.p1 TRINITY_DN2052_c5_g1~~TRINITY_DN2052_c5_g1_i1.p1  ORF type:complete len:201 (+),score=40.42 TRINITY_DN2052_c5_g1_i1:55-657(+)